jgi:hypothetical protein
MTPQQFNYCELLFTMIDRKISPVYITYQMYLNTCTYEMQIYVDWLLNRWLLLRDNNDHYPTKMNHQKLLVKKVRFNID